MPTARVQGGGDLLHLDPDVQAPDESPWRRGGRMAPARGRTANAIDVGGAGGEFHGNRGQPTEGPGRLEKEAPRMVT